MILSFFAFLIVSFSMVFGLDSFATGLHNEMPEQVFQSQKYETAFATNNTFWDQPDKSAEEIPYDFTVNTYNNFAHEKFIEAFNDIDGKKGTDIDTEKLVRFIADYPKPGNLLKILSDYNHKNPGEILSNPDNLNAIKNAESYLLLKWNNANFISFALSNYVFPYTYKDMDIWDWSRSFSQSIGTNETLSFYLLDKNNPYERNLIDTGKFVHPEYKTKVNVVFTSSETAKKYGYKLGQNINISFGDQGMQSFVYGGNAAVTPAAAVSTYHDQYLYYIMNYVPSEEEVSKGLNFKKAASNNYTAFQIRNINGPTDSQKQYDDIVNKAYNPNYQYSFLNNTDDNKPAPMSSWRKNSYVFNAYLVYIGMTMFSVIVCILMVILDIIVAWFLIKEIIRSLSTQLLFLKTLGMNNREAALIPSTTLFIFLILSLGLGLIGMLGIQALFISITSKFLIEFNVWSQIKPFSLVIIFGIAVFLLLIYFLSTFILLKNIDLTSNSVFSKSGSSFGKLRGILFNRSVNSGLTFSFTMKNIKKVLAAFFITILVTALSFIALGFKTAIDRGIGKQRNFVFKKETSSFYNSDGYINYSPNNGHKTTDKMIKYLPGNLPEKEMSMDDLVNNAFTNMQDIRGQYLTRNEITDYLSHQDKYKSLLNKWNKICQQYDLDINSQWSGEDNNFKINFGAAYYGNYLKETVLRLNDSLRTDDYQTNKLFVLDDSDPRVKQLFGPNDSFSINGGNPVLPVVVGDTYLRNNQLKKGDTSLSSYIDYHAQDTTGNWLFMDHKDNFKIRYGSSTRIIESNEVYVKKSEFMKLLKYEKKLP